MKVEFSSEVAEMMIADQKFCDDIEDHIKIFNLNYEVKMIGFKGFGVLIRKESEDFLKVSICE